jgi:hypothetical protein
MRTFLHRQRILYPLNYKPIATVEEAMELAADFEGTMEGQEMEADTTTAYVTMESDSAPTRRQAAARQRRDGDRQGKRRLVQRGAIACFICKGEHSYKVCPYRAQVDQLVSSNPPETAKSNVTPSLVNGACLSDGVVICDNAAGKHVFGNIHLLREVEELSEEVVFEGIGGTVVARYKGKYKFFDDVYYSPDAKANVLSCSYAQDAGIRHGHDEASDTYYFEHRNSKLLFPREGGIWAHRPSSMALVTVTEMEAKYSVEDRRKARAARELSRRLGVPCNKAAYYLAVHNSSDGYNGITMKHFDIADEIWGTRVAALGGKSTEPSNLPVRIEPVFAYTKPVLDVFVDIFFVNREPYLISVAKPIGLIMVNKLPNRSASAVTKNLIAQLLVLHKSHFVIRTVVADGERAIHSRKEEIERVGIRVQEVISTHVPQVENVIKTVKSWARGVLAELPYKVPASLAPDLIGFVVQRLNMFSSKRGHNGLSAIEALTGEKVNLHLEARAAFGDYVQATIPNLGMSKSNINVARTEPAIALNNSGRRGAVRFYSLLTHKRVTRTKFSILPTPIDVIASMNKLAAARPVAEIIGIEDMDNNADINEFTPHDEEIVNNFQALDEMRDDLTVDHDGAGEGISASHSVAVDSSETPNFDETPKLGETQLSCEVVDGCQDERAVQQLPEASTGGHGYNTRRIVRDYRNIHKVYNITVKKALQEHPHQAREAIKVELEQLVKKDCFEPVTSSTLSEDRRRKLIRSFMFLKIKNTPQGDFEKMKARLVANGAQQSMTNEQQLANSSPTAGLTSLLIVAAIAAKEKRHVVTVDVKSAYINARMPEDDIVDIVIEPSIATELVSIAPQFASSLRRDGSLVVKLKGALYGTQQAAKLWYLDISKYLLSLGFVPNERECCVFNIETASGQLTVVLYVDDLKLTCVCLSRIDWLIAALEAKYLEITVTRGKVHHYLGMTFDYTNSLRISMTKYEQDLVAGVHREVYTPAMEDLFAVDDLSPTVDEEKQKWFHTQVAKLMFLSKRARPDVLLPVAYLATKVQRPTERDLHKLHRVLAYLKGNPRYELVANADTTGELTAYTDASHAMHPDRKSHTGASIYVYGLPVYVASRKQHAITLSSFEAELMALSEEAKEVVWCRDFLQCQLSKSVVPRMLCDNLGLVQCLQRDSGGLQSGAKHIEIRHYWLRELICRGVITIEHVATADMWADIFTKPLQGTQFRGLPEKLVNQSDM